MNNKLMGRIGAAVAVAVQLNLAYAITPPGTPPTFYCDTNRPANADTVEAQLNTTAVSAADRGNQPRWEHAEPSSPGVSVAPDPLPAPASGWVYFTGTEISGYPDGLTDSRSVASVGFMPPQPGAVANTLRYFRYRFVLDATVDPTTYTISLGAAAADDAVLGTYLNGKLVAAGAATTLGGGATPDLQWRTGMNELTFAIFDTVPTATYLVLPSASQAVCRYVAPAPSAMTPVPTTSPAGLALLAAVLAMGAAVGARRRG
jgi:hypothetical protein